MQRSVLSNFLIKLMPSNTQYDWQRAIMLVSVQIIFAVQGKKSGENSTVAINSDSDVIFHYLFIWVL